MLIIKKQGRVSVDPANTPLDDLDQYILCSYTFCLPLNGVFSPEQFAHQVKKVYSLESQVNKAVYDRIRLWDEGEEDALGV